MMVKTRSASVALNDFPSIESNFVYTNLDRKNLLFMIFFFQNMLLTVAGKQAAKNEKKKPTCFSDACSCFHCRPTQ